METKHTKTPWKVTEDSTIIGSVTRNVIAECCGYSDKASNGDYASIIEKQGTREANAAFIVRAVNAHDDLVAALEAAVRYVDDVSEATIFGDNDHADYDLLDELRTALAKAKG